MRALTFDVTIPGYVLGRTLGRWTDAVVFGRASGLRLAEVPDPALPTPEWVRLELLGCGVCGSDLGLLTFHSSPALEPFSSFPAVLGHEMLARVVEVGAAVRRVRVGDRVSVDPAVSCVVRGRPAEQRCLSCADGFPATCGVAGEPGGTAPGGGVLSAGGFQGFHRDLPGGFAERTVAHESQLHPVPEALDDMVAVLVEPLSIGVHALLRTRPDPEHPALVIGSGPIALGVVWALRALGHRGPIVSQVKRPHEAELARELGATRTVSPGEEAREALLELTGARPYRPRLAPEVYAGGGYPLVLDCVGTRDSVDQALRHVASRGQIALLGCAGTLRDLDLSPVWAREVRIRGFLCYGLDEDGPDTAHTFRITQRLLATTQAPVARLVTHTFRLDQYREAFAAAARHRESGALKVRIVPR